MAELQAQLLRMNVCLKSVYIYQSGGGFEMDENALFVDSFKRAYSEARGKNVKVVGSPAGCDSRLWRNIADCPTIQFGPGNLAQCHGIGISYI